MSPFGQPLKRFWKIHLLILHQKRKYVPADSAAKTMENLFVWVHNKRRRFLIVKRTIGFKIPPCPFQRNIGGNHFYDVIQRLNLIDNLIVISHLYPTLMHGNKRTGLKIKAKRHLLGSADSNARTDSNGYRLILSFILSYKKWFFRQIHTRMLTRNSKCLGQLSWAVGQLSVYYFSAPLLHDLNPRNRLKGTDQNGSRNPFCFGHNIETVVISISKINITDPGSPKHDAIPQRNTPISVACGIICSKIGFGFHNFFAQQITVLLENQNFPDELKSNHLGASLIKRPLKWNYFTERSTQVV